MVEVDRAVWSGWLDVVMSIISPVFGQARSRRAAFDYVTALLRADGRRSCWQLAELAGHASPRRLQALLADYVWDARVLAERVRALLVDVLADPEAVLAIDETAELKAGEQTVAVARQYAGITGQVENCQTVVFLAYVTVRAHALMDFLLYLPKGWVGDAGRRARAHVPDTVGFATKPQLAVDLIGRAVTAAVPFAFVVADEVYGRAGKLRAYVESLGKGYVFTVPTSFTVSCFDGLHTVKILAGRVPAHGWSTRSCGAGCKGHRWYDWAWIATSSPTHWVLIRRNPDDHSKVTFFYCHTPHGATLATLVRVAGRRWPVETCFQAAKSILGIHAHQVRLWHSWQRHTTLSLLAAAVLAVATAAPAEADCTAQAARPDSDDEDGNTKATDLAMAPPLPAQPSSWRETGTLPTRPDQPPPADPGMIKLTVAEARRLLAIATSTATTTVKFFHLRWSQWRRRHQACARWHHWRTRLRRYATT
jgi:SRSO17 transposase